MMKPMLLIAALLAVFGIATAEELRLDNGLVEIRVHDGEVALHASGAAEPTAVFAPAFGDAEVKVFVVDRRNQSRKIVRLSTPDSSLAIELPDQKPFIRLALNRNASPVKVTIPNGVEALVIPDLFGEDAMFFPGEHRRMLPAYAPGYLMLLADGSTLTCLPINAQDDAVLSEDFDTLTISQKNSEDYIFVLNAGPNAWAKTTLPELGKQQIVEGWKAPFPACWQASFAVGTGFVPIGDGLRCNWNIATAEQDKLRNAAPRFTLQKPESNYGWQGGFEGSFRYPAVVNAEGNLEITNPRFREDTTLRYDVNQPLFIYAFYPTANGQVAPGNFMEPRMKNHLLFSSTSFATLPATCATTEDFERIFRHEQGVERKEEIIQMLESMQCFVEGVRGRIENARVWAQQMRSYAEETCQANPALRAASGQLETMLDAIENQYQAALPRIKTPSAVEELSMQVIALTGPEVDPEEAEEQAKKLGAAIRTIGGGQDRLTAEVRHLGKCIRQHAMLNRTIAETPAERRFWDAVYQQVEELLQTYYWCDGK